MMIFETIFFVILLLSTISSLSGLGGLLLTNYKRNIFYNIFFGYIFLALIVTVVHFFLRISPTISIMIFFIGIIIIFKTYKFQFKKFEKEFYFYLFVCLLVIPIYISQKYHEDFGYYHLPYIINIINEKIIFGLGNTNNGFIHNSLWLNIQSIFFFKDNFNYVNLPTFSLYLIYLIFSLRTILNDDKKFASSYFLIVCIFYIALKFTRFSEFGNDIPALIFSILAIFNFFKIEENKNKNLKKYYFFCNISFTFFAILIKFSVIPVLLLTIYIFFKYFNLFKKEIFKFNYFFIYFLCIFFFLQQFIYSGCFVFPSKITCLKVSWFSEQFINLREHMQLINKSYYEAIDIFNKEDYLKNFNWFPFWIKRNLKELVEHLLTMLIPLIFFLFLLKKYNNKIIKFNQKKIFVTFVFIGFLFWFNFSPVYRFGIIYFLSLIFLITLSFYSKKFFSKKKFIIFFIIILFFNFFKNMTRIYNKDEIFYGIEKIENNYKYYSTNNAMILPVVKPDILSNDLRGNGWQGRLCWDRFLCSYNEITVRKINGYFFINSTK